MIDLGNRDPKRIIFATGLKNDNQHVYPAGCWEQMRVNIEGRRSLVDFGTSDGFGVNLSFCVALVQDLLIEPHPDLGYIASVNMRALTQTPNWHMIENVLNSGVVLYATPVGHGIIGENGVIEDYKFSHLRIAPSSGFRYATPVVFTNWSPTLVMPPAIPADRISTPI